MSDAFSAIMMTAAFVFALTTCGMIDAFTTRRPFWPRTRSSASTTAAQSLPILQVPLRARPSCHRFDALCMMISCGVGVGVLPEAVAQRNAGHLDIQLVTLTDAWAHREFKICARSWESLVPDETAVLI